MENARTIFDDEISYANSIEECLASSPVCVLTLLSKEYKAAIENYSTGKPLTIVDCWRQIEANKVSEKIKIVAIGRADSTKVKTQEFLAVGKK
jgi:hypothetical protein